MPIALARLVFFFLSEFDMTLPLQCQRVKIFIKYNRTSMAQTLLEP